MIKRAAYIRHVRDHIRATLSDLGWKSMTEVLKDGDLYNEDGTLSKAAETALAQRDVSLRLTSLSKIKAGVVAHFGDGDLPRNKVQLLKFYRKYIRESFADLGWAVATSTPPP
jgi:hypothetical protein